VYVTSLFCFEIKNSPTLTLSSPLLGRLVRRFLV
jgi:hypothetical protein